MLVKNDCSNSPCGLIGQVRRSLSWIDPLDLDGIGLILLMDEIEEPDDTAPDWHKKAKANEVCVSGQYFRGDGNSLTQIVLYVRALYRGIPSFYRLTTVPGLSICYTLAHEVGHHLIAKRGYIFEATEIFRNAETEEEFCNRYAFRVTERMMIRWYHRLGMWALRDLSGWYYAFGCDDWKSKSFKKAAENFYTSFHLDRNREEALYWYWRAKEEGHAEQVRRANPP